MTDDQPASRKVGAFDIRVVIAGLIGFYGVVLIVMGFVADTAATGPRPAT
ncbi:hypothetical protein GCM10020220_029830 [Nonomuraea rubra]